MNPDLITVPQMAKRLQISKSKAYRLIGRTDFPSYNFGERQTRVFWPEVEKWVKSKHTHKKGETV
ncbi:excisionase family DNA-binding protein [Paenibacillus sp. CMAA1739]|uniref:helix-turn-helix transcriptional regulator n=1 Tax=Paenibacillus ottowii TaxID=2315729 RepID=UPI00272F99AA|nr:MULTISPECIES: excisionase family DNA-binding protein [Paenibacillus]MDP1513115.1 excisionase family DNA-binding protein [Paenibacillus ottowii]MEC4569417.1 excisionase family DNA-binding protein [Paenibacillus sp. CMAA1739]